jgi:hypothetical protein
MKVNSFLQNLMETEKSTSRSDRCISEEEEEKVLAPFRHKAG